MVIYALLLLLIISWVNKKKIKHEIRKRLYHNNDHNNDDHEIRGGHIHVSPFSDVKNNLFQKKQFSKLIPMDTKTNQWIALKRNSIVFSFVINNKPVACLMMTNDINELSMILDYYHLTDQPFFRSSDDLHAVLVHSFAIKKKYKKYSKEIFRKINSFLMEWLKKRQIVEYNNNGTSSFYFQNMYPEKVISSMYAPKEIWDMIYVFSHENSNFMSKSKKDHTYFIEIFGGKYHITRKNIR
jgi:hypothetical protein